MQKTIQTAKTCTLERRFFATLSDGSSEWEYVLQSFGIPKEEWDSVEEIEVDLIGYNG